jgi:alanine-synthesizing transaminase
MNFSNRIPRDLTNNRIYHLLDRLSKKDLIDLTESNPTKCGFLYPSDILQALGNPAGLTYEPYPFGIPSARRAIADYLRTKGQSVDPENIVLTSSTSEAYSFLFKLLCDSGDSFLVPTPGYPLLEYLTSLEGVKVVPYPLLMEPGWQVDLESVEKAVSARAKGLIVVNPQNPTGCLLSPGDHHALFNLCLRHSMAYISDEVFLDYIHSNMNYSLDPDAEVLSFRLGGLSKSMGMPQLKLAWIVLGGPPKILSECLERLELIADTYLSVGTPVQLGLNRILEFAPEFQKQMMVRVTENRMILGRNLKGFRGVRIWPSQGGWYALVEILEKTVVEEEMVISLIEKHRVIVQPGGFYDFPRGCFMILSLLPTGPIFLEGLLRIQRFLKKI